MYDLSKPKVNVSIVTANYNNCEFLDDYFKSILNSTVLPKEIIFVDDKSSDNSLAVIKKYENVDILKLIPLSENLGFANALNIGIENASGSYIMRLDPDDYIVADKIEKQYDFLIKNPHIDILGTDVFYYNENRKKIIFISNFPKTYEKIKRYYQRGDHGMFHTTVMGKTSLFKKFLYRQEYYPAEDYDIFSRMVSQGIRMENLNEALTYYRIHSGNLSVTQLSKTINFTFQLCEEVFNIHTHKVIRIKVYLQRFFYRKFLSSHGRLSGIIFIIIAGIFNIRAGIRRIIKNFIHYGKS
ncbi:MAG: hypothetical protein AMS27_10720 [Bacteroides sp. SM23_62_1]|nr:MAG: hypothetical protein AMS27_10720 [Bacteroides sp. SM23_62_1]